jgi:hypothetical protein
MKHYTRSSNILSRLALVVSALLTLVFVPSLRAASYELDANPNYSFGAVAPTTSTMAAAIQARLGKPITVVSSLPGQNTSYPPILGDSGSPPYYIYGPSGNGAIMNLNLFTNIVTGIVSGQLKFQGTQTACGAVVNYFVLRVFSSTQYWDVLVRYIGCTGSGGDVSVVWDFYRTSGPRSR